VTLEPGEYKITNGDDVVGTLSGHPDDFEDIPRIYTKTDVDGFLWQVIPEGPGYQLSAGRYPSGIATGGNWPLSRSTYRGSGCPGCWSPWRAPRTPTASSTPAVG
jgi:hypothetical protein